jgi:hypothetical protein
MYWPQKWSFWWTFNNLWNCRLITWIWPCTGGKNGFDWPIGTIERSGVERSCSLKASFNRKVDGRENKITNKCWMKIKEYKKNWKEKRNEAKVTISLWQQSPFQSLWSIPFSLVGLVCSRVSSPDEPFLYQYTNFLCLACSCMMTMEAAHSFETLVKIYLTTF